MEKCPVDQENAHYDELFYFALYGQPGVLQDDDPVLLTYINQRRPPEKQVQLQELETDDPIVLDLLGKKKLPEPPRIVENPPDELKGDVKDEELPIYRRSYIVNFDWSIVKGEYRALDYDKYLEIDEDRPTARMCRLLTMVIFKLLVYLEQYLLILLKKTTSDISTTRDKIQESKSSGKIPLPCKLSWLNMYGMPYFKDVQYFCCPPNEDAKTKKWNNEMLVSELHSFCDWSAIDCHKLEQAVKAEEVMKRSQKANRDRLVLLKCLEAAKDENRRIELQQKISALPSVERIKCLYLKELCEDIHWEYDWLKIAAQDFHGMKHPDECRAVWQIYLHPKINRGMWTNEENARLKELVKEYKFQNWEAITEKLGTNRTPLLVMQHYQRNLNESFINKEWTEEEDEMLVKLVGSCRFGTRIAWKKIAQRLKGHTKQQIFKHWTYHVNPNLSRRAFTEREDMLLVAAVRSFGENFHKLLELFPYRTRLQLRKRYKTLTKLYPNTWDDSENEKLLSLVVRFGEGRWKDISEFFTGRTPMSLKDRYDILKERIMRLTEDNDLSETEDKDGGTICHESRLWRKVRRICPILKEYDKLDLNGLKELRGMLIKKAKVSPHQIRTVRMFDRQYYEHFKCVSDPDALYEDDLYNIKGRKENPKVLKYILHLLHAKLHTPSEEFVSGHHLLSKRDSYLLEHLSKESFMVSEVNQIHAGLKYCLPPNFTTLSGFYSIMLHRRYVLDIQEQEEKREVSVETGQAGQLFEERFCFLFAWPALATAEPPAIDELPPYEEPESLIKRENAIPRKRKKRPTRVELLSIFGPKKKHKYTKPKKEQNVSNEGHPSEQLQPSTSSTADRNNCTLVEIKDKSIYKTLLESDINKQNISTPSTSKSLCCSPVSENSDKQQTNTPSTSTSSLCSNKDTFPSTSSAQSSASFSSASSELASKGALSFNNMKYIRTYSRIRKPKTQPPNAF